MIIRFFNKYKEKIILALVYITTFTFLIYPYTDFDWGWHYRYGEYLLTHGHILLRDIYSWTMQGYLWVNHEWLFDPIIYLIFKYTGYIGSALAGAIVTFFCFFLLTKTYKLNYWKLTLLALFFVNLAGENEGLRAQVLALVPLTLFIYLLTKAWKNIKYTYLLPPLMLLWVNLHGTFAYGLIIEVVFFAVYFFVFPKERLKLIIVGVLTVLATFINPFKFDVYLEGLRHYTSPYLQEIGEWKPLVKCSGCHVPTFFIFLALIVLAFIKQPTIQNLPFLILGIIFLIPTFKYLRNEPIFVIMTFPLLASYFEALKINLSKYKVITFIFLIGAVMLIEYNLFTRLPEYNFYKYNENDYCNWSSNCSVQLANLLLNSPPQGKGFNCYDQGGYLIGKGVPFKLFIDGRMHVWQTSNGYYPFADFISIFNNVNIDKFNEYNFDWVIVPSNSPLAMAIKRGQVNGSWIIKYQDPWQTYFINNR